jgi:carbohydrate-binding DOMON domain-containing protein
MATQTTQGAKMTTTTQTTQTLSPDEIAAKLTTAGIAAKDFWQAAAGGDMIPLSAADVDRVIATLV